MRYWPSNVILVAPRKVGWLEGMSTTLSGPASMALSEQLHSFPFFCSTCVLLIHLGARMVLLTTTPILWASTNETRAQPPWTQAGAKHCAAKAISNSRSSTIDQRAVVAVRVNGLVGKGQLASHPILCGVWCVVCAGLAAARITGAGNSPKQTQADPQADPGVMVASCPQ